MMERPDRPKTVRDVHIIPLAREVDRAVLPFVPRPTGAPILHAHKAILLVPATDAARRIAAKVEKALQAVTEVERHEMQADQGRPTAGIEGTLQQVSWLCRRELKEGHRVHINLSSGTKLVAFAAGLAGMAHLRPGQGSVYYVQPSGLTLSEAEFEEHGQTSGVLDVEELELMPVLLPEPIQMRVLAYLRYHATGRLEYRDLIKFLSEIPGSGYAPAPDGTVLRVRNWNNATTTRMVRTIIAPLQQQGLVDVQDHGRQKAVHITSRGRLYACMSGLDRDAVRDPLANATLPSQDAVTPVNDARVMQLTPTP